MTKSVLLIDDDTDEHDLFIQQLSEFNKNIQVISAYNGPQAFKILDKTLPGYIFLDINMPIMNGLQVLEKLKGHDELKQIPVYMYSTSDGYHSKKPALTLGAVGYFRKPNDFSGMRKMFELVFQ